MNKTGLDCRLDECCGRPYRLTRRAETIPAASATKTPRRRRRAASTGSSRRVARAGELVRAEPVQRQSSEHHCRQVGHEASDGAENGELENEHAPYLARRRANSSQERKVAPTHRDRQRNRPGDDKNAIDTT